MHTFVSEMLCNFIDCFVGIYTAIHDMDTFILKIVSAYLDSLPFNNTLISSILLSWRIKKKIFNEGRYVVISFLGSSAFNFSNAIYKQNGNHFS